METRLIDVHDDEVCARAYEVIVASKGHERPWNEPPSLAETLVEWRHVDEAERMEMWGALDGGELVGVATLWLPMEDNTSMTWFDVQVDPAHRGRGAGTALVERVVERARDEGRVTTMVVDFLVPPDSDGHGYRRFAERHGFHLSNTEIMRHLELPVADDLLDRHAEHARPRWEGDYRLETHVGGVPEHLQAVALRRHEPARRRRPHRRHRVRGGVADAGPLRGVPRGLPAAGTGASDDRRRPPVDG